MKTIALFPGTDALESAELRKLSWLRPEVKEKIRLTEEILLKSHHFKIDLQGYMTAENDRSIEGFQKLVLCSLATQVALFENYQKEADIIDGVMGLSLGDIARSVVSGLCTYEQAVSLLLKFTALSARVEDGASIQIRLDEPLYNLTGELKLQEYDIEISVMQNDCFFLAAASTTNIQRWIKEVAIPKKIGHKLLYPFPLHSSLMNPISLALKDDIERSCQTENPKFEIFSSVFGRALNGPDELVADSILNINSSLWFTDTIRAIVEKYKSVRFVNIGPAPTLLQFIERMKLASQEITLEDWFGGRQSTLQYA